MLYIFDLDGTLIKGYLGQKTCPVCKGHGRVPMLDGGLLPRPSGVPRPTQPCERCKGKGFKFDGHLPYENVAVLPMRLEKLAFLATTEPASFAIATNQGGVAMGYQTEDEVYDKMGRAVAALDFFYGQPFSIHVATHHPDARVGGFNDPDMIKLRKPLPGMIHEAREAHGYNDPKGGDTIFVGDMPTDRDCAEAAGVQFAWAWDFFDHEPPPGFLRTDPAQAWRDAVEEGIARRVPGGPFA